MTSRWQTDAVKLHTIIGKSSADRVAPVLKLCSCPLELVVIMSILERLEVEENVELTVGCGNDGELWLDGSKYVEGNFLENIWEDMFDAKRNPSLIIMIN